jgi:site-specific DNA recombinase
MEPIVAMYARVSSQRQADGLTIHSQVAALKTRIVQDGFMIADERCFLDEGVSGSTLLRPALERLRDLAHAGELDWLYIHSPDRLARNYVLQMVLLEEFTKQGVQVIFLNHDPQDQSAEGNLLLQMQGMIAEYERAKILERTRRGRRYAARQGKVSALGHAPYGYRYVPKHAGDGEARYDIVLEEARVVREIFNWVGLEGLSLGGVIRRLAEQGIPTATGKPRWDRATIRDMLLQPAYMGQAKYGKTRLIPRSGDRRPARGAPAVPRQAKVEQDTLPHEQETIPVAALVSETLFTAAAEKLAENRVRHREQKRGAQFLLSGLLVCQSCQSAYCGRNHRYTDGRHYQYYRCLGTDKYRQGGEAICSNASICGEPLETEVWADLCRLLRDPARVRRELKRRLEQSTSAGNAPPQYQVVAKLERRMARLLDAYEHGYVDKPLFEARMGRLRQQIAGEREAQRRLEETVHQDAELRLVEENLEAFSQRLADGLDHADFTTRRKLLKLLVQRIEVDQDEIRIIYRVNTHPFVLRPARGDLQHCLEFHLPAQD